MPLLKSIIIYIAQNQTGLRTSTDEKLNDTLEKYFEKIKNIPGFKIEDIKLQITGRFTDEDKSKKDKKNKI